jgi:hypothetical protein
MDDGYLERSVNRRTYEADTALKSALGAVMAQAAAKGMLSSGNTLWSFRTETLRIFEEGFKEAAQFAYNLRDTTDEPSKTALSFYAKRVIGMFMLHLGDASMRLGMPESMVAGQIANIGSALEDRAAKLLDDFVHGMSGNVRMKKDPVVSIALSQSNSPNAVQQVGFGQFSQTAFTQQHNGLVETIEAVLRSAEFQALPEGQQDAFRDIADVVREEASKSEPDAAKLKRWSERLLECGKEVGLHVAVAAIQEILKGIFGG